MATETIRPNSTTESDGWRLGSDADTLHGNLSDQNTGTGARQTAPSATFIVGFGNLSVTNVTINSVTLYVSAQSTRESSLTLTAAINGSCSMGSLEWHSDDGITSQNTSARTTDGAGGSISVTEVNAMTVSGESSENLDIKELWAVVDYTEIVEVLTYDDSAHHIDLTSGNIDISSGNIFI